MSENSQWAEDSRVSRRTVLGATGAGAMALSGCLGGGGGGVDSVTLGGLAPLSGSFELNGNRQQVAQEMAVDHATEEGDFSGEVDLLMSDTESDPGTAQQRAREHLEEGADLTVGGVSSAVAGALGELAMREGHIHLGGAGDATLTGENCMENLFVWSDSAIQQTNGGLGYALREGLGESVFEISSDFAWGQSIQAWNESELVPQHDAEYVGNRWTPLGASDFSSAVIEARESDADIINFTQFGGDQIAALNAADEFGLLDGERVITTPATSMVFAQGVGPEIFSYENLYASAAYHYTLDTSANNEFVEEFRERSGGDPPLVYTPHYYVAIRSTLRVIDEIGSTDPDDLRPELEGLEGSPQIWGEGERMRACDHRFTAPSMTVQGLPVEEADYDNWEIFEIVDRPSNLGEYMRPCEQTGCEMDN